MKLIKIFEKRKNPKQNPKHSAMVQLKLIAKKYGTDNIWVRFSGIDKVGINPKTNWNTPIGVYAYPLAYVIDKKGNVPFRADMPYIHVFTYTNPSKLWDLSSNSIEPFGPKVIESILDTINVTREPTDLETNKDIWYYMYRAVNIELAYSDSKQKSVLVRKILTKAGVEGVVDYGSGILHSNEPTQGVFFVPKHLKLLEKIQTNYYFTYSTNDSITSTRQRPNISYSKWSTKLQQAVWDSKRNIGVEKAALYYISSRYHRGFDISNQCAQLANYMDVHNLKTPDLIKCLTYDQNAAFTYLTLTHNRTPVLEAVIKTNPILAWRYASEVLRTRWIEAEPYINKNQYVWNLYQKFLMKHKL